MIEDLVRTAITILVFLFVLGGLVLIHEVGHYFGLSEAEIEAIEEQYWRGGTLGTDEDDD